MPIAVENTTDGSGKVGQGLENGIKALFAPDHATSELKTIIADVLQVNLADLDETQSFLRLGGDSITAVRIMARCRAKGISLNVADMIDARNIADLCQRVSQSVPRALLEESEAFLPIPNGNIPSAFHDESTVAKPSEFMKPINGHDISNSLNSFKTIHQQVISVEGQGFIESIPTSILLGGLSPDGTHLEPLDFIHSALVTAASVTTSSQIVDILFYDFCEATSEKKTSTHKSSQSISQFRMRSFPSEDDARLLGRIKGCTRADSYFGDEGVPRQAPCMLTPGSSSENNIILVDVRQLRQQHGGEERPVGHVSPNFLSDVELNLDDSLHLSLTLSPTKTGISCLFGANDSWQSHYGLDGFINVFISSMKGMLKRLHRHGSKTPVRQSREIQPTQASENHTTSKSVQRMQSRTARLDALGVDSLKHILRPEARIISSVLPCSPMQQAFLTVQSTNPNLYQCCFVLKLTNRSPGFPIDARHVGASWREVVKRHTTLRTIFVDSSTRPGQFDQVVVDNLDPYIEYIESLAPPGLSARAPVEFGPYEPPHRFYLAQLSSDVVQLKLEISHALVDGQSTEVLLRDLCTAYHGAQLSGHVLEYGDFSSYLSQLPPGSSPGYWSDYFSHASSSFLPMDRGHETLTGLEMVSTNMIFDSGSLQGFCGTYGVTVSNVCQLAWGLVLRCFTGSNNVSFSYITSGRSAPLQGIHDAVGPFVATLPCCLYLPSTSRVEDLLKGISKDFLEGLSHRYDAAIYSDTKTSARQLGNTTISFQRKLDMRALPGSALDISVIERLNPTDYDIALGIESKRDGLDIQLDFWNSRLEREHAQDVLEMFGEAIHAILRMPRSPISAISLLRSKDRSQLQMWNQHVPGAKPACLHEQVAEMTLRQPNSLAICAWDGDLTYNELFLQAATLAHHLIKEFKIGPETMIALCMKKSKYAIIAMLAILQAGGVVVPLGVSDPLMRIEIILNDTAARTVLVDAEQASRLADLAKPSLQLTTVDTTLLTSLCVQKEAPTTQLTAENTAWAIFTSGSTGVPKGVLLSHKSLSTSVQAHGAVFGTGCRTRVAQFAAYTFDISISDIFSTLHHGGCVCVFSEKSRMNDLTEALKAFEVNYANLTPTVVRLLDPTSLPLIKILVVAGEPLDAEIIRRWSSHATIFNAYGPAECAILATCYAPTSPMEASIIGFPTGTRLWVTQMTDHNQLCPIGVTGELLIDGPMLARGYLNDDKKTSAAFIENPAFLKDLDVQQGDRFYKTGDLVRQNKDGSLTHLGRRDTQVKIRGQRVEIGEIEACIAENLQSARSVIVLITDQGQEKEQIGLVAIVDFHNPSVCFGPSTKDKLEARFLPPTDKFCEAFGGLRKKLFEVLPPYMVPSLFLPISEIPLNASGKLDRRATRTLVETIDPELIRRYLGIETKVAASTRTQRDLLKLWAEVLGIDITLIGVDDDFFQIGGDSLGAIRIVAAAREKNDLRMTVADIFQHPQLSELAQFLDQQGANSSALLVDETDAAPFSLWRPIQGADAREQLEHIAAQCNVNVDQIEDIYPCTPLQEGLIAITSRQPTAYIIRRVFSFDDTIDVDLFKAAWQTLADAAPILRTRILFGQQVDSFQVVVNEKLQWQRGKSLESYLEEDRTASVSHGGPLGRFGLIEGSSGVRFFVWTAHHSTYDGWSMNLILRQIADIYLHNTVPRLVPYVRFIRYLDQADSETTKSYWRKQLQDAVFADLPPLPSINYQPRPQERLKRAIGFHAEIRSAVMMSDVLRAAWALVSAQYADQNGSTFAVALSGRNAPVAEIASLVAPTITTVPLHVRIDRTQTVQELLQSIQEQRIGMIPYEQTGLQRIKRLVPEVKATLELKHLFVVQPAAAVETGVQIPGMEEVPIPLEEFDSYGLCIECTLSSTAVNIDVRFDEKMISAARVERLLAQFVHVTQQLYDPAELDRRVSEIDLVSPQELQQIKEWNSSVPCSVESCIHFEVAKMARQRPDAPAICAWDGNLTYSELDAKAATLAHHLIGLGIGPESTVSLCMDKSQWAVIAMLAILQTGGAVVPLGTSYPIKRAEGMISDAASKLILVDQTQADRLIELANLPPHPRLIKVDSGLLNSLPSRKETPITTVTPNSLAWLVYTSGSTGVPKGVMLEHSALCTSLHHLGARFGLGTSTRTIQFAAHTFDVAIQDVFATLIWGGTVCIPSEEDRMNNLAGAMRSMDVNFAGLTSTVARLITPAEIPSLRTMVLNGEPVQAAIVETWHKHVNVLNSYGPSECSINSTCNGPLTDPSQHSNIGVAMGTRLWVTETTNPDRLCAIGIPGELLVEGPQLSRGYLKDTGRTNQLFLTDPAFTANPALGLETGRRMYRTGDLVQQDDDGSLTYIGRRDNQVKIGGQRAEIGEIEHWISKHLENVRNVAVTATDLDHRNHLVLAAVIEFADQSEYSRADEDNGFLLPTDDLRDAFKLLKVSLLEVLPAFLVPAIYVPVVRLPVNISGKLDRRAVSHLVAAMGAEDLRRYTAVQVKVDAATLTETELQLRRLWAQTLGIDVDLIGAQTHFFEIGGDSVIAMRIVVIAREIQLPVTVADIFTYPQLSKLAAALDEKAKNADTQDDDEDVAPFELLDEAMGLQSEEIEELVNGIA